MRKRITVTMTVTDGEPNQDSTPDLESRLELAIYEIAHVGMPLAGNENGTEIWIAQDEPITVKDIE